MAFVAVPATITLLVLAFTALAGGKPPASTGPLPDLQTVVPLHLQLHKDSGRELLHFSNGIANTGPGPWALRPDPPVSDATTTTTAIQEIRSSNAPLKCGEQKPGDPCYTIVSERVAGTFEFHPEHNHWHIGDVALFEVRRGSPTGPVVGGNSIKTTFCLIDWYKLEGNSSTSERTFWDCQRSFQGIQSGWVDQYHHSLPGQSLDLTGVPNRDDYYLVSTANASGTYQEVTRTNNTAWVKFRLYSQGNGGRALQVTANSPCSSPGLCGIGAPNR